MRSTESALIPDIAELHRLPHAVLQGLQQRGLIVRCGPGYRGQHWEETPAIRAAVLQATLPQLQVICGWAAVWVWGVCAWQQSFLPRTVTVPPRSRKSELVMFGSCAVANPLRVATEILLQATAPHPGLKSCILRLCAHSVVEQADSSANLALLLQRLRRSSAPQKMRALRIAASLFPEIAALPEKRERQPALIR